MSEVLSRRKLCYRTDKQPLLYKQPDHLNKPVPLSYRIRKQLCACLRLHLHMSMSNLPNHSLLCLHHKLNNLCLYKPADAYRFLHHICKHHQTYGLLLYQHGLLCSRVHNLNMYMLYMRLFRKQRQYILMYKYNRFHLLYRKVYMNESVQLLMSLKNHQLLSTRPKRELLHQEYNHKLYMCAYGRQHQHLPNRRNHNLLYRRTYRNHYYKGMSVYHYCCSCEHLCNRAQELCQLLRVYEYQHHNHSHKLLFLYRLLHTQLYPHCIHSLYTYEESLNQDQLLCLLNHNHCHKQLSLYRQLYMLHYHLIHNLYISSSFQNLKYQRLERHKFQYS